MSDLPLNDEHLWEMLESSSRERDLTSDPALQPLADHLAGSDETRQLRGRLQTVDAAIGGAFGNVPVPAGAAERCLARLRAEALPQRKITRRWLLAAGVTLASAGSLLLAVVIGLNRWQPFKQAAFVELAVAYFAEEEPAAGRTDGAPADYPFSHDVLRLRGTRWREVPSFLGRSAVAYDLPAIAGSRATLYVVNANVTGLGVVPPGRPSFATGNCAAAAWQGDGVVYVLVVSGPDPTAVYKSYLDQRGAPIT